MLVTISTEYQADGALVESEGAVVLKIAELLERFATRSALMVGDRSSDRDAAWANGLPHAHLLRGYAAATEVVEAEAAGAYDSVFQRLAAFGPAIDTFFDAVRVNVQQPDLKRARHAFLREIHALFARYAEFSEVAPLEQ